MPISIFLSHPQPINNEQKDFIEKLFSWLGQRGFMPRTLGVSDYSDAAPLEAIRGLMSESNGLLCIAFRRTQIHTGTRTVRVGRNYESRPMNDQWLTSPWAHIEPAMAYQIGLPVLILRESGVLDDGVLEKGIIGLYMPEFDLATLDEGHYLNSQEWAGVSGRWEQHVRNVVANKGSAASQFPVASDKISEMSNLTTLTYQDYTVRWICALSAEKAAAWAMLDERHQPL